MEILQNLNFFYDNIDIGFVLGLGVCYRGQEFYKFRERDIIIMYLIFLYIQEYWSGFYMI